MALCVWVIFRCWLDKNKQKKLRLATVKLTSWTWNRSEDSEKLLHQIGEKSPRASFGGDLIFHEIIRIDFSTHFILPPPFIHVEWVTRRRSYDMMKCDMLLSLFHGRSLAYSLDCLHCFRFAFALLCSKDGESECERNEWKFPRSEHPSLACMFRRSFHPSAVNHCWKFISSLNLRLNIEQNRQKLIFRIGLYMKSSPNAVICSPFCARRGTAVRCSLN